MKLTQQHSGALSPEATRREAEHRQIARRVAADCIVLMENDGVLPLRAGTPVALYGAGARHTIMGGTGSGSVNCRPGVSVERGLLDAGIPVTSTKWLDDLDDAYAAARQAWQDSLYAMSTPGDFDSLYRAHAAHPMQAPSGAPIVREGKADIAVYVISRVSGEGADRQPGPGDFELSPVEEKQLGEIAAAYKKCIVVLNVGGVIDLSFLDRYPVSALVLLSQAGMEGGHALADVLTGAVNPSGRLSETWARRYADYPCADTFSHMNGNLMEEKYEEGIYVGYRWFDSFEIAPRYPFGHGLSYTAFERKPVELTRDREGVRCRLTVKNVGSRAGKDAVLLFAACPAGLRRKERKRLVGFAKTPLLQPGETAELLVGFGYEQLASYHAGQACWYLDKGEYRLMMGPDAESLAPVGTLTLADTAWGDPLHRICPLHDALREMQPQDAQRERWEQAAAELLRGAPVLSMDAEAPGALRRYSQPAGEQPASDPLVERLSLEEKACLVCGRPRQGDVSFIGDAAFHVPGAAGETTALLEKYGVSPAILADGPAGLRLTQRYEVSPEGGDYALTPYESLENRIFGKEFSHPGCTAYYQFCTAIPVGMCLSQSFDTELVEEIGGVIAREMVEFGVTLWLAPGMNIKRNPLCGRNFEYYSEDPLLTGRMAAAITRGVQACPGAGVTIKHFACNNQEDNRRGVSSTVSERALREIYLKGFEIAVREAQPWAIMTSYNKINGEHTANSRDLCTLAAREEWGFEGVIMTDWTTTNRQGGSSAAKCVSAGNDLVMPGLENDIKEIMDAVNQENDQSLDIRDLDACCARLLRMLRELGCVC